MLRTLYAISKSLRLNFLYRLTKSFLPKSINNWVYNLSEKYSPSLLVQPSELQPKFRKAAEFLINSIGTNNIGDYLEFGVFRGTSLNCMYQTAVELKLDKVRLFGFDSFKGLPAIAAIDIENELQPGDFACTLESAQKRLTRNRIDWKRTFLVKGWYADILTDKLIEGHAIKKASIIMIDCDLYSSAKESLKFCGPLIKDQSIIFFDDWNSEICQGERRAFEEFLEANPQLNAGQFDSYLPSGRIFLVTNITV
jgi:hypothetical protein